MHGRDQVEETLAHTWGLPVLALGCGQEQLLMGCPGASGRGRGLVEHHPPVLLGLSGY